MGSNYTKQGKTVAIIAYITIIGTIIAFFINQDKKNKFANFHIRQALGTLILFYLLGAFVTMFDSWTISYAFYIFIIVLWGYGFFTAIREEQSEIPFLGAYFQKWFSFIN